MGKKDDSTGNLKPVTFKIPFYMQERIDELIAEELYSNKAVLIREAIQELIDYELRIPSVLE